MKSRKDNIPGLVGPPFSIEEVQKAVKAMKSRKVPGADHIMAEALKAGIEIAEMLPKICNAAQHQEKLPTDWCRSTQERVQVNPLKLPKNFPDIHPEKDVLQNDTHEDR